MGKKRQRVFVVGGGTGGHLFPAVALGQTLAARNYKVFLITDPRCQKYLTSDIGLKVKIIQSQASKSNIFSKIQAAYTMAIGFTESLLFLLKVRPKIIIGFGGYTVFPMLLAGQLLRIPIIIHEQNSFLGHANCFFAKYAKVIALPYSGVSNIPSNCTDKLLITGNPVRKEFKNLVVNRHYQTINIFRILVFGGSQGAKFFSTLVPNALKFLTKTSPTLKLHITQQAHRADWPRLRRVYQSLEIEVELADFFHDLPKRYRENDIAICRAGASTISEFINVGLPAIYIPFPAAANNHQLLNAMFIEQHKAGWYFEQNNITPEILAEKIYELSCKPNILATAASNLLKLKKDTETILADTVEKIIRDGTL